ncbi:MAG: uroporphyrinogen decarboxylase family protein [Patescibacteria group bacterium]
MTKKERVLAALRHERTDYTPYQIDLTEDAREAAARFLGDPDFTAKIGNHLNLIDLGGFTPEGGDVFRDQFGVAWNRTVDRDIGVVQEYLLKAPSLRGYRFPDPADCPLGGDLDTFLANASEVFSCPSLGFSLFERAWTLRGMENLLADMIEYPDFVDELLDAIVRYNLGLLDRVLAWRVDGVRFGDDYGQQRGLIMGPRLWRRFIKPRLAMMFARVKKAGRFVMLHSCGDVAELFPDLIEIGLDIFNTFQPEVMDVDTIKREYGKDLTFYGGVSTQRVLPFQTPGGVKAAVREMIRRLGWGGGYIVAPTHAIPRDVPPENIAAFIEAVREQEATGSA